MAELERLDELYSQEEGKKAALAAVERARERAWSLRDHREEARLVALRHIWGMDPRYILDRFLGPGIRVYIPKQMPAWEPGRPIPPMIDEEQMTVSLWDILGPQSTAMLGVDLPENLRIVAAELRRMEMRRLHPPLVYVYPPVIPEIPPQMRQWLNDPRAHTEGANKVADELVRKTVTDEEWESYQSKKRITVVGTTWRYQIQRHGQTAIYSLQCGCLKARACLQVGKTALEASTFPAGDRVVTEYLLIRNDEERYLDTAIISWTDPESPEAAAHNARRHAKRNPERQ